MLKEIIIIVEDIAFLLLKYKMNFMVKVIKLRTISNTYVGQITMKIHKNQGK